KPVANTQRPAFTPCANFTLPGPSSTGSRASTDAASLAMNLASFAAGLPRLWHCAPSLGRRSIASQREAAMTPRAIVFIGLLLGSLAGAQAQDYPNRPITIVVPFPAGGLTDVPARLAATLLQAQIGQGVVIENRTGGSGVVGAAYAARATPDGYTLFANSLADTQNMHYLPVNYSPV